MVNSVVAIVSYFTDEHEEAVITVVDPEQSFITTLGAIEWAKIAIDGTLSERFMEGL